MSAPRTAASRRDPIRTSALSIGLAACLAAGGVLDAQGQARTGWEDVRPTGWPAETRPQAAMPAAGNRHGATVSISPSARGAVTSAPKRISRRTRRTRRYARPKPVVQPCVARSWDVPLVTFRWRPSLLARAAFETRTLVIAPKPVSPNPPRIR